MHAALEAAGRADRASVAAALRAMDITTGAAKFFPGGRVKFDARGRRESATLLIVQWQKRVPVTVYPAKEAVAEPLWPKR
jgi:branched-chain amino acid transport system substrate-binding protein